MDPALEPLDDPVVHHIHIRVPLDESNRLSQKPGDWNWSELLDLSHSESNGIAVTSYKDHSTIDGGVRHDLETVLDLAEQMISDDGVFDEDSEEQQEAIKRVRKTFLE